MDEEIEISSKERKKISMPLLVASTVFILSILFVAAYIIIVKPAKVESPERGEMACPADAKLCPDGSVVSRTGLDCEFSQCPVERQIVGGPCEYEKFSGTCKINRILSDNTVKFTFNPETSLEDNPLSDSLKREQIGEMENLLQELDMKIKVGDSVNCQASLITKGTCTPIMFKFME